jgi:hypothetical protein
MYYCINRSTASKLLAFFIARRGALSTTNKERSECKGTEMGIEEKLRLFVANWELKAIVLGSGRIVLTQRALILSF